MKNSWTFTEFRILSKIRDKKQLADQEMQLITKFVCCKVFFMLIFAVCWKVFIYIDDESTVRFHMFSELIHIKYFEWFWQ